MIPHIARVVIANYKSMADVDVTLAPLTLFVGPNGVGKSNFIDALAFVKDSLADSMELAFKNRGGVQAVRRKSGRRPTHFSIGLTLDLGEGRGVEYSFRIVPQKPDGFEVARESCVLTSSMGRRVEFEVVKGRFTKEIPGIRAQVAPGRLALFAASATEEFRPVYDFLVSMQFYSILPQKLRELQKADSGEFLLRDGGNAAAVLKRLQNAGSKDVYERICRLLSRIAPGVEDVEYRSFGQKETLRFKQNVGHKTPVTFDALSMSDGTLRVLGLLLAIYQPGDTRVVGIEEPEATVHPAAAELVLQVLLDASHERQVLLTTHSPDILDSKELSDEQFRAVTMAEGSTIIAPLTQANRKAIRERLYTPGELLRAGELAPEPDGGRPSSEEDSTSP